MSQSLSQLYIHLTFGTKNRYPFLKKQINESLHAYMAGTLKHYESPALIINSVADHVHVLFRLSKNYALAKIIEEVKKQSSIWVKEQDIILSNFSWQGGYGAFSVSSSKVETVKQYILTQEEHHRKVTFREEFEEFIKQYDIIEYDPAYFWS